MNIIGKYISSDESIELDIISEDLIKSSFKARFYFIPVQIPGVKVKYQFKNGFFIQTNDPNLRGITFNVVRMDEQKNYIDSKCFTGIIKFVENVYPGKRIILKGSSYYILKSQTTESHNYDNIILDKEL